MKCIIFYHFFIGANTKWTPRSFRCHFALPYTLNLNSTSYPIDLSPQSYILNWLSSSFPAI